MRPLQEAEQLPINTDIDDLDEITDLDVNVDKHELDDQALNDSNVDKVKRPKAHIIRRHVEDYLEQKALERSLSDVFDNDYYNDL